MPTGHVHASFVLKAWGRKQNQRRKKRALQLLTRAPISRVPDIEMFRDTVVDGLFLYGSPVVNSYGPTEEAADLTRKLTRVKPWHVVPRTLQRRLMPRGIFGIMFVTVQHVER